MQIFVEFCIPVLVSSVMVFSVIFLLKQPGVCGKGVRAPEINKIYFINIKAYVYATKNINKFSLNYLCLKKLRQNLKKCLLF